MKKYSFISIIFFFALDIVCLKGQTKDPFIISIEEKLSAYCKYVPFEDIYIHTDRDTYIAGEYFWFNTYLFNRKIMSLSSGSSYAYVELLDAENQPASRTKVRLENGSGGGGFVLPDSLSTGEYTLRAYTSWMKNFLPNGCFMKTIIVYNPFHEIPFKKKTARNFPDNSAFNITFFPEGGRLLYGFVNRVGVRVYYKDGGQKVYKGYLSDETDDTLAAVVVDSTGIGSFDFFAKPGKAYKLVSETGKNSFFLPAINPTGFSLNVKNGLNDSLKLTVNYEEDSDTGSSYFYLVIQSRGKILFGSRMNISGKSTGLTLAGDKLNPGINQISIFDSGGNPVCNRLVFKPLSSSDKLTMKTNDRVGKRGKISLEIDLDTSLISKAELSNYSLSVSVINGAGKSSEISDYLTLGDEYATPESAGLNPADISKLSPETIDNYLLSVKSNWINWENVIPGKLPETTFKAEKGNQFISGFCTNKGKNETYSNNILFLSIPGKVPVFKYAETDHENRFVFQISDKESLNDYIIQQGNVNDSSSLQIESPFAENYPETGCYFDSTIITFPGEVTKWSVNYQVEKIYGITSIGDTIKSVLSPDKPVRFYGKPDQELIMSDYISLPVMNEVFFELIPGVSVITNKSKYGIFIHDPVSKKSYENFPALLIDGVIINDPSVIINLDPGLVEKIDIIKNKYVVGDVLFSGIVSVITNSGDFSNISLPLNAIRLRDNSYDFVKRYKSPDYSTAINIDRTPDFRNTLYWNHNLRPDSNGKIVVDIITSDFVSDYDINFQGVAGGKLFSARKTIRVE